MLRFLSIKRLAVIDSAEVEFGPGLNVLTGETGAGKSILVEAVGLLLGGRASGDLVRTGEESASIEAIFERGDEELVVRREITAQGRSRSFVNGTLATAGALKDLAASLVELHGQHEHQTLLDPTTHLDLIDEFGRLESLIAPVAEAFGRLRDAEAELLRMSRTMSDRDARQELIAFQLGELERAALERIDEDAELAATRQVLASAERVERLCTESYTSLYESDDAVLAALGGVWRRVDELAALDRQFQPYLEAREGIKSQLEDLALFLRRYANAIDASPARLQQVEERLALLERLKRKYGPTLADVFARRDRLRAESTDLHSADECIADLKKQREAAREAFGTASAALSRERRRVAVDFAKRVEQLAAELAMEGTRFDVRFGAPGESDWSARGIDAAEFFVSPNPGEDLRPLARIASGGELSRIMLAIKTMTARSRDGRGDSSGSTSGVPGLIFDEVDAGIGGRVAEVVGRRLHALASTFQVLCITHLPQIAAYADTHFVIEKRLDGGRTATRVHRLDANERVGELARMLGGERMTDALRASASEMLAHAAKGESKPKGESERAKAKPPIGGRHKARYGA